MRSVSELVFMWHTSSLFRTILLKILGHFDTEVNSNFVTRILHWKFNLTSVPLPSQHIYFLNQIRISSVTTCFKILVFYFIFSHFILFFFSLLTSTICSFSLDLLWNSFLPSETLPKILLVYLQSNFKRKSEQLTEFTVIIILLKYNKQSLAAEEIPLLKKSFETFLKKKKVLLLIFPQHLIEHFG